MTKLPKRDPTSHLRVFRAYLLIVLLCTLVLFASSISYFRELRSGHIIDTLSEVSHVESEIWFVGIAIFLFLCLLAIGLFLLVRVSTEIRWFEVRSHFVSGVSHEFKTPLSLIRLYSETLARDEQDFTPEERKNYIGVIARESERLSHLIDNVLDFSRLEKGQRTGPLQEGDPASVISETALNYSEYLMWRGYDLKISVPPSLPPVRFNPEQVSQVLLNLLDNARKYSGKSRLIRLVAYPRIEDVVVEVQDYGIGIPEAEQENIFKPFYRVPNTGSKGGCGLGLYLAAQVMEDHGGKVEVLSEVGRGSIFRLVFPISRQVVYKKPSPIRKLFRFLYPQKSLEDIA